MKLQITQHEYELIHEAGLQIDHVFILQLVQNGANGKGESQIDVPESVIGMLRLKGFVDSETGILTEKAIDLLGQLEKGETSPPIPAPEMLKLFAVDIHAAMQMRLLQLTGKKQKTLQNGKYSFLCNSRDLEKKLKDVWNKYGPFDPGRVGGLLLAYVDRCHKVNYDRVMLVEYYIMKEGTSKLWTDLENMEEQETQGAVDEVNKLVDPKSLF